MIFRLKRSTPSFMIYGELGLTPKTVAIQARIVSYWSNLLENDCFKLTSAMYIEIFRMHRNGIYKSKYIDNIKSLIEKNGFSCIWLSQNVINSKWFSRCFKQKHMDQYIQSWSNLVDSSSSLTSYHIFKDSFEIAYIYIYIYKNRFFYKNLTEFQNTKS